ncbi:MAG: gamma-glutamylcyclotransferase [Devosiaceae bacterium]|nr:gamma-glutamylcyclotransferase [Devosiaceae bacterium MH13]
MDLWVFGYGSLIWRPGFPFRASYPARLFGYHRSLCVYSYVHRGTPERPGLVMGLDRGGSCSGLVFHVDAGHREEVLRYLREREQSTFVYQERMQRVHVRGHDGPSSVEALVYCVDRLHEQYAGLLAREEQLAIVAGAQGKSGPNPDYVVETSRALERLGVHDAGLRWLTSRLAP